MSWPGDLGDHMLVLAKHLYEGGELTAPKIRKLLGVSKATSSRYMLRIECALPVIVDSEPAGLTGRFLTRRVLRLMKTPNDKAQGRGAGSSRLSPGATGSA